MLNYFRQRDRAWVLSLLAAVALVYLPFLGSPFVFDDVNLFSGDVLSRYAHSAFNFDLRWLPYASLGWTAALFSDAVPHFFHLGNALLHACNVILLFYLLRKLAGAALPQYQCSAALLWGAWLGALIFAIHPVAVYAVGYMVQRSTLMATLFGLLMYWAYLSAALTAEKRWLLLSVAAYFAACFSKEHSALLPVALAAMAILLRDSSRLDKKALWLTWSGYLIVLVMVVSRAKAVVGVPYEAMVQPLLAQQGVVTSTPALHLLSVMTQAGLFFKYLLLWLLPNPAWMSVDMREPFIALWTAWQGWLGVIAFIAYGVVALHLLWRGGRRGLLGFALLYPWLMFLIEFSSIRVQEPFVLYRSYLWMPGMMLLLPLLLVSLPGRRTLVVTGLAVLLLLPLAWNRLWVFADNYRMWNDAALLLRNERVSGADRIYYNRGQAARALGRWQEAAGDFERALAISPQFASMQFELAMAYAKLDRHQEAVERLNAAISIDPGSSRYYYFKAISMKHLHQYEEAHQLMKKSCELKNSLACLWMSAPAQPKQVQ